VATGGDRVTPLDTILRDSRAELAGALAALGPVAVLGAGRWTPPAVLLTGGAPWVEPLPGAVHARAMGPGTYRVRWGVLLVAGAFDGTASQAQLELLASGALAIVAGLDAWERPYISAPRQLAIGGAEYLTATVLAARVYQTC
jgi:hypothetical protein